MNDKVGKCLVCGASPTVKTHLAPRALFHDMRGDHPRLYEGSAEGDGIRWPQSGHWDDRLLCLEHEAALHASDDYAVEFIRNFERDSLRRLDGLWMVPRSDARLISHFAVSVLWRYSVSTRPEAKDVNLGASEQQALAATFLGSASKFAVWMFRHESDPADLIDIFMPPFGNAALGVWSFAVGGFLFRTVLPGFSSKEAVLGNLRLPSELNLTRNRVAKGAFRDLQSSLEWRGVVEIGANMRRGELAIEKRRGDQEDTP